MSKALDANSAARSLDYLKGSIKGNGLSSSSDKVTKGGVIYTSNFCKLAIRELFRF